MYETTHHITHTLADAHAKKNTQNKPQENAKENNLNALIELMPACAYTQAERESERYSTCR